MAVSIQIAKFKPILMESHFAKFKCQCYPLYGAGAPVIAAAALVWLQSCTVNYVPEVLDFKEKEQAHTLVPISCQLLPATSEPSWVVWMLLTVFAHHKNVVYVHVDAYWWQVLQLVHWNKAGAEAIPKGSRLYRKSPLQQREREREREGERETHTHTHTHSVMNTHTLLQYDLQCAQNWSRCTTYPILPLKWE